MHETSALWKQIFSEFNHVKEIAVSVNGVEYHEDRILYTPPSVNGKLFDAPSVGNARSRTLTLNLMPYDGVQSYIPPMSEIRLYVRLKSADGQRVSEWIPKGVFYADEVKRDTSTGMLTISAFDAMMKMERQFGNAVVRITFDDGFGGIQRFVREIGQAMPTPLTPTHEGQRFIDWYPDPDDTPTLARDMLFTANWARKFTVTFDSGDGTPQTFSCFEGDATPTPTTPTKEGYTFTGWTPTPAATVTADATYTAQWTEETLLSVAITSQPTKTAYTVGDTLDYTGLAVTASYSDGTTADVTAECVISPAAGTEVSETGAIIVTVSYNGETLGTFKVMGGVIAFGGWWTLCCDGSLDIYYIGNMPNYNPPRVTPWESYKSRINRVTFSDSVQHVGSYALANCESLSSVTFSSRIGENIYEGGSGSSYPEYDGIVTTPDYVFGVKSIGGYAFYNCRSLNSVNFPASLRYVDNHAFANCDSLSSVAFSTAVAHRTTEWHISPGWEYYIEYGAPESYVETHEYYQGIQIIYGYAFNGCRNLSDVYYTDTEESWGYVKIETGNDALTSATIHHNSSAPS